MMCTVIKKAVKKRLKCMSPPQTEDVVKYSVQYGEDLLKHHKYKTFKKFTKMSISPQ